MKEEKVEKGKSTSRGSIPSRNYIKYACNAQCAYIRTLDAIVWKREKHSPTFALLSFHLSCWFASSDLIHPSIFDLCGSTLPNMEPQGSPPREEPVNSIENDGAITPELWKVMMDLVLAIYEYREEE